MQLSGCGSLTHAQPARLSTGEERASQIAQTADRTWRERNLPSGLRGSSAVQERFSVPRTLMKLIYEILFKASIRTLRKGARGRLIGRGTALHGGRQRVPFPMRSLNVSVHLLLPAALGPGVDSASNRTEYQESSWG
jgi:hypothetical protein